MKISLAAENERTVFQKLREAALAYHLTRKWSKERDPAQLPELDLLRQRRLRDRVGGADLLRLQPRRLRQRNKGEPRCASVLLPHEAALLAAMVASPSAFDPIQHPVAAKRRRDLVLLRMTEQGYLTRGALRRARRPSRCPRATTSPSPRRTRTTRTSPPGSSSRSSTTSAAASRARSWRSRAACEVKTTIDSRLQTRGQKAIDAWLPNKSGPRASLVAISNKDGAVRAMIGGDNYGIAPFNLATQGQRQPGSSFKPFVLAEALKRASARAPRGSPRS